jgi:hypothetical protein
VIQQLVLERLNSKNRLIHTDIDGQSAFRTIVLRIFQARPQYDPTEENTVLVDMMWGVLNESERQEWHKAAILTNRVCESTDPTWDAETKSSWVGAHVESYMRGHVASPNIQKKTAE